MRAARTIALGFSTLLGLPGCTPGPSRHPQTSPGEDRAPPPDAPARSTVDPRDRDGGGAQSRGPRPDLPRQADLHCPIAFDDADVILARVGDTVITACDLAVASAMDTREGLGPATPAQQLERVVRETMLASAARARGLDRDVVVARRTRDTMAAALVRAEALATAGWAAPTDAEVEAYYHAHEDDFTTPERVHLREIVLDDEATAREVITAATSAPFDTLITRTVTREGLRDRGDLGLVPAAGNDRVPHEIAEAGFSLTEPGGVYAQPVRIESVEYDGNGRHRHAHTRVTFHVVQLLGRVEGSTTPLAAAATQIRFRMAFGHYQSERQIAEEHLLQALRVEHPPSINANNVRHAHVRIDPVDPDTGQPPGRDEHSRHHGR